MPTGAQNAAFKQVSDEFKQIEQLQLSGQAAPAFERSKVLVNKQPKWPYAHYAHGVSLMMLGRFEESRKSLRKAISLKEEVGVFHAKLAEVMHRLDDTESAIRSIDRAIELDRGHPPHITTKAWMLRLSGRTDEAYTLLNTLYESGERDHRMVRIYSGTLGQMGEPERGIEALRPLAEAEHPDPKVPAAHWYVLAKLYDQIGEYDHAFEAATRGADLNAKTYDAEARSRIMRERCDAWSQAAMKELARSRVTSEKPVFIVGMPRSGTTLVEQIIAAHPDAYGAGELINIFTAVQELVTPTDPSQTIEGMARDLKTASLDRTARRILRDMEKQAPSGARPERITDKLLLNFQHLGLIEQLFPNARVIACERHPLDTFISSYLLDFEGHNAHAYTDRPEWFAHFYALHRSYLEHYKRVCSIPILEVRYEEIVLDQRAQTERILEFIGLPFDEACMRFFEHRRAVITASSDQVRKKMYTGAIGRHANYEPHLGPVREALRSNGVPLP